jgi:RHS repeat-associated protein
VSGALKRRYVHGGGVDEPLVQYNVVSGVATKRYLYADHQGSIIAHSDNEGAVAQRNAYDPYGIPKVSNAGRFGYTGQMWIPQLGLNYYKARFYSPRIGRFLQTDPIFYQDDMNLYAYVHNSPLSSRDPTGLADCPPPECKVHGTPQKTNGPDGQIHADQGQARGQEWAKSGTYKNVWYNTSLRKASGNPSASIRRADVTGERHTGEFDLHEDTSKSQTNASQLEKGNNMLKTLPANKQGVATAEPLPNARPIPAPSEPAIPVRPPGGSLPRGGAAVLGPIGWGVTILQIILQETHEPTCAEIPNCI